MSGDVVLYDYWRSSAAYRVRIALALKSVAYRKVTVDLTRDDQQAPDHVARNPQGLVPVLCIDGLRLTQSLAILEYLEETRPAVPLLPRAPDLRAKARMLALAVVADIHPVSNLKVLKQVEALADAKARAEWNLANIGSGLAALETMLEGGPFAIGAEPSFADCAIVPQIYNARRWGVDMTRLPKLSRIEESAARHPAFMAAYPAQ